MSEHLVPPDLEDDLLAWLKAECPLWEGDELINAAETIHGLIHAVAIRERPVTVTLVQPQGLKWKRSWESKGVASAFRELASVATDEPLDERKWRKAWQELPPLAIEFLAEVGWRWRKREIKDGKPVWKASIPSPDEIKPFLPAARKLAASRRGPDRRFQDLVAAQIWCIFCEVNRMEIVQPAYVAGGSERSGPVFEFFEMLDDMYGRYLQKPLVSLKSGSAVQRVRKLVPKRRF